MVHKIAPIADSYLLGDWTRLWVRHGFQHLEDGHDGLRRQHRSKKHKTWIPCLEGRNATVQFGPNTLSCTELSTRFGWRESRRRASTGHCFGNRGSCSNANTRSVGHAKIVVIVVELQNCQNTGRRHSVRTPRLLSSPALY